MTHNQELLNEEQSVAAYAKPAGVMLVKALAGSGKTRMLRNRVPHILRFRDSKYELDSRVLVMAFGKDVATEIKNHFGAQLSSKDQTRVDVRTFHSMAATLVGKFKRHTPLAFVEKFEILKPSVLAQAVQDHLYDEKSVHFDRKDVNILLALDGFAMSRGIEVADAIDLMPREARNTLGMTPIVAETWVREIKKFRHQTGFLMFDDLIPLANSLPDTCFRAMNFSDVLADELQDLNFQQRKMVFNFMKHAKSFTGVGDSNQAIFGFAGADSKIFENMTREFPAAEIHKLTTNYRCSEPILEVANQILEKDIRTPMRLTGLGRQGPAPMVYSTGAKGLIEWINMRRASGENWKDMAVLYRLKAHAPTLEMALAEAKIPFVLSDLSFFEQAEINDMLAYFKVIYDPKPDFHEWRRIVDHYPGMGQQVAREVWNMSGGNPVYKAFSASQPPASCRSQASKDSWVKLVTDLDQYSQAHADPVRISELVRDNLMDFWFTAYGADYDRLNQRLESVAAFVSWVTGFGEGVQGWDILTAIKRYEEGNRHADPDADAVRVTTVHKAKGREWENVALWNVGPGNFPKKANSREEEAEENRLLYVAATRAKRCLAVICPSEDMASKSTIATYCPNTTGLAASLFVIPEHLPAGLTADDVPELDWLKSST